MTFELTDEGLTVQTVDEIFDEMAAALRAKAAAAGVAGAANLDVSSASPLGQVLGVMAERESKRQLVTLAVYNSRFPSRATGDALAQGSLVTGTIKLDATKSVVGTLVTLTAGTTLPAGSRANVDGDTTAIFETLEDITNGTGITDDFAIEMTAVEVGPTRALAATLTVINTPVSGWSAVTNAFDAQLGRSIETDPALRLRREEELRSQGATVVQAIAADVDEVEGVIKTVPFENKTDAVDGDGLPPHSFEIVVWDGVSPEASDNAIAQAIFDASPAGIASESATLSETHTGTAVEAESGDEFTITFSRAEAVSIWLEYDLEVDPDLYPIDGDTQVKAAVVAYANARFSVGDDVIATSLYAAAYAIAGVLDVVEVRLGAIVSPGITTNTTIASRQIATFDTSRVLVTT